MLSSLLRRIGLDRLSVRRTGLVMVLQARICANVEALCIKSVKAQAL